MARKNAQRQEQPNNQSGLGPTLLTAGAAGAASSLGTAGGVTVSSCPPDDQSFYCSFVRFFNMFKMVLVIIIVLIIAYFIYKMFFASKSRGRR